MTPDNIASPRLLAASSQTVDHHSPLPAVAGTKKTSSHVEYERVWLARYPDQPCNISVFNSGVMVINFSRWDSQRLSEQAESWLADNLVGGSQMPINLAIKSNYAELNHNWNCAIRGADVLTSNKYAKADSCMKEPRIRHWTGRAKPWLPKGHLKFFWLAHASTVRPCLSYLLDSTPTALTDDRA